MTEPVSSSAVVCDHCGAPLDVPPGVSFAVCAHCGSRLRVKRSASAAWTELAETAGRIEKTVDRLDRRTALADLDREWDRTRQSLLVRGKDGATSEPAVWKAAAVAVAAVAFAGFAAAFVRAAPFPRAVQVVFPLFPLVGGLFAAGTIYVKARKWEAAEADYRRRRAELERDA